MNPYMNLAQPTDLRASEEWTEPVPTAYSYGYLWAAHTLFYWHRDQDMVPTSQVGW